MTEQQLTVIAVTGGPCGGKTSVLTYLRSELEDHGVTAIVVPEAARLFIGGGFNPTQMNGEQFQEAIIRSVVAQEDIFKGLASRLRAPRVVVLCDRGAMDSKAYVGEEVFNRALAKNGWNVPMLRDARYDAVLHLVSAADGAEEFYTVDGERFETLEQARLLDEATRDAWVGHSHLNVIDNSTDFDGKKFRALKHVLHHLGLPVPLEIERKYRVSRDSLAQLPKHAKSVHIEQHYLRYPDGKEERIRRRSQDGHSVYYLTQKRHLRSGVNEEIERQLTSEQYALALASGNVFASIRKNRWCFVYKHQYFELDEFSPMGLHDLCLLEIELTDEQTLPELPEWILGAEDVTDDPGYSNKEIALSVR